MRTRLDYVKKLKTNRKKLVNVYLENIVLSIALVIGIALLLFLIPIK